MFGENGTDKKNSHQTALICGHRCITIKFKYWLIRIIFSKKLPINYRHIILIIRIHSQWLNKKHNNYSVIRPNFFNIIDIFNIPKTSNNFSSSKCMWVFEKCKFVRVDNLETICLFLNFKIINIYKSINIEINMWIKIV